MFECPKCKTPIPKWKSALMSNYTKIKCENCGAKLKADRATMTRVTIICLAILVPLVLVGRTLGVTGLVFAFIVGFLAACIVTVRILEFEVVEE